jgi:hypothetical protein
MAHHLSPSYCRPVPVRSGPTPTQGTRAGRTTTSGWFSVRRLYREHIYITPTTHARDCADTKRFEQGVQLNPYTLTILEQIPGYIQWYASHTHGQPTAFSYIFLLFTYIL